MDVSEDVQDKLKKDSKAPEKLRFIKRAEMFFAAKYKDEGIIEKLHDKESHLICSLIYQLKYSIIFFQLSSMPIF